MGLDLIWALTFSCLRIWAPRNLVPEKFGPGEIFSPTKIIKWHFHAGIKFLGDQIFWGPNFCGPNFLWTKFLGPKFLGAHKLGTK